MRKSSFSSSEISVVAICRLPSSTQRPEGSYSQTKTARDSFKSVRFARNKINGGGFRQSIKAKGTQQCAGKLVATIHRQAISKIERPSLCGRAARQWTAHFPRPNIVGTLLRHAATSILIVTCPLRPVWASAIRHIIARSSRKLLSISLDLRPRLDLAVAASDPAKASGASTLRHRQRRPRPAQRLVAWEARRPPFRRPSPLWARGHRQRRLSCRTLAAGGLMMMSSCRASASKASFFSLWNPCRS